MKRRWWIAATLAGVAVMIGLVIVSLQLRQSRTALPGQVQATVGAISELATTSSERVASLENTVEALTQGQNGNELLPAATDTPGPSPTPQPTPTDTPIPPSPTPNPNLVPFASPDDPASLNPVFGWQPGGNNVNSFDLSEGLGTLRLVAGPRTDQWARTDSAPLISYPVTGDFQAQVKMVFDPVHRAQLAGLGVKSSGNPHTWLRITRTNDGATQQSVSVISNEDGTPIRLNANAYADDTVFFKIEREGSLFTLSYSRNGINWVALQKDFVFEMPAEVEIFITAFSTHSVHGVIARFSDFIVSGS